MSLINYQGDSKILKRICALLKVTDVQENGVSIVDSDGIAHVTGGGGGSSTLAGLSDVDVSGASAGNVLAYNGTSQIWEDLALTIPTKTSDLNNDSGFITNTVNNLTNYYLKSETYTKAEVNTLIGQISTISILVVQTLPTQDIQTNIIYLVPKSTAGTSNAYDEYINTDGTSAGWELIGDTEVDLSNYYTKSEVDTLIGSVSGGHTIKNDSGTALAQKDNLKFAGTYSVNSGDDSVVNIVRTVNSESAISQMSAAEKKGIIVVDDGQAEEIDAYDVPYGNSDVGTALDGKVNTSDIVDNLTTNDATKPLSAKQGKVLKEVYTRVGSVVRPDSTYTTLLSYINGYVVSLDRQEYTFACEGFSDMPRTDWSYDCTVTRGAGLTVRLHRILSNNEDWIREIDFSSQWADSWRRAIYDNYVDEEIIAFTNTKCNTVYEIRCRKVGNVVSISTVIQPSQDIAANEILTNQIPARFRPTHNYAYFVSSNNIIIQVYGDGTMGTSNISAAIPANWYYPVNMVYIR